MVKECDKKTAKIRMVMKINVKEKKREEKIEKEMVGYDGE